MCLRTTVNIPYFEEYKLKIEELKIMGGVILKAMMALHEIGGLFINEIENYKKKAWDMGDNDVFEFFESKCVNFSERID